MPEDYTQKNIIAAIVGFLCCGVIGAIFAVIGFINGNDVKKYYNLGQYDLAAKKAAEAKKWFKISIIVDAVLGVLFWFLRLILIRQESIDGILCHNRRQKMRTVFS